MSSPIPSDKSGSRLSVRELCYLALIAAMIFSVKVALSSLPNINLNAVLIILTTLFFGWKAMYAVGVYVLLEGLVYGFHVWWICYLYIWPLLVVIVMLFRKNTSPVIWAVIAGIYGLLFGPLMYLGWFAILGGWKGYFAMWVAGIPYDITHAVSNFLTVLVLFRPLYSVMARSIRLTDGPAGGTPCGTNSSDDAEALK